MALIVVVEALICTAGEGDWLAPKARGGQTRGMTALEDVAILRVELEDIEPLIWRRVAVRTSMNLKSVHSVIQAAMGWLDCHLWEIAADERKYGMLIPNDPDWNERIKDATTTKLPALLTTGVREIGYVYDMSDNWQHRVIVEKLKAAKPGVLYPQFLGGERRCPPEDCGGMPGYYEFLEDIASKQSKKRKAALGWYGGSCETDYFVLPRTASLTATGYSGRMLSFVPTLPIRETSVWCAVPQPTHSSARGR
jgi:hypothetical protein